MPIGFAIVFLVFWQYILDVGHAVVVIVGVVDVKNSIRVCILSCRLWNSISDYQDSIIC